MIKADYIKKLMDAGWSEIAAELDYEAMMIRRRDDVVYGCCPGHLPKELVGQSIAEGWVLPIEPRKSMNDKDLQIENILDNNKKDKPKVDGKAKGDRTELNLCKLLTKHFGTEFTKAPGSGTFATIRESLPEHAKKTLTGDLCVPEKFKWVIESKGGYEDDIDLANALDGDGVTRLDEFIEQSSRDAEYCGRKSIICWKRNRKPWLAMLKVKDLEENYSDSISEFENYTPYRLCYREWVMISLDHLLKNTEKDFWFEK